MSDPTLNPALATATPAGASEQLTQTSDAPGIASISETVGTRVGPYKLLQVLGEGGFGVVYMAEQTEPVRRKVALKIIKPGMDTKAVVARFEAERQALAMMDHPNIARVLDGGATASGRPYFVMELVKGIPITKYCDQEHLELRQRMAMFIPVCHAVQHAHQKGIIHRDLKPANILVAMFDGKPVIKVIDFGVAKAVTQTLTDATMFTQVGQMIGTLEYMAPEQAEMNNLDIDTRADIYSLGVTLYELLTGSTPFSSKELKSAGYEQMLRILREKEPERPSTRISHSGEQPTIAAARKLEPMKMSKLLAHEPDWIVLKCIEKERVRRYETANALAMDIGRYLNDEPILAGPPSRAYRMAKYTRKYKKQIALAAAVAALLLLATITSITLAAWARSAEKAEREQRAIAQENEQKAMENEKRATESAAAEALQRTLAESREKDVQAMLKYFQDNVLAAGKAKGLGGGLGKDVTLREAVDAAERRIADAFRDQPVVEASIRHSLGITYRDLGEYDKSSRQFDRALELREKHLGEHRDTMLSRYWSALALGAVGKQIEMTQRLNELFQKQKEVLGPDDPDTLRTQDRVANETYNGGKPEEALAMLEEVLRKREAILGPDHKDTLASMYRIAQISMLLARVDRANEVAGEAMRRMESMRGEDFPEYYDFMELIAYLKVGRDEYSEAATLFEKLYRRSRTILGDEHPSTLVYKSGLAGAYASLGRYRVSVRMHEQVFEARKRTLAPDNYDTIRSIYTLAGNYAVAGRNEEAMRLIDSGFERVKSLYPPDHLAHREYQSRVAVIYFVCGRHEESLKLLQPLVEMNRKSMGERNLVTLAYREYEAAVLSLMGRHEEALPICEEVARIAVEVEGEKGAYAHWFRFGLAIARARAGKIDEAISLGNEVFEGSKKRHTDFMYLAGVHSIAAGKTTGDASKSFADRAMELLHQAADAGYRDYNQLTVYDPDFAPLRHRDDLQQLAKRLEQLDEEDFKQFLQSDLEIPAPRP